MTASAVASDGKLYFTAEDGTIYVVQAGPTFELLATNAMNDVCMATPAISAGMLYIRTKAHIYGIGTPRRRVLFTHTAEHSACKCWLRPIRSLFRR